MAVSTEAWGGPWTGWFEQGGKRYSIIGASLDLTGSSLSGSGTDAIGAFTWEGENLDDGKVVLRKKYVGSDHIIVKTGTRFFQDGKEVIEGTWDNGVDSGPFRIESPAAGIGQTGPWTGWFEQGGQRYSIIGASLDQTGSSLSGSGTDAIGAFTWEGENLDDGQVVLRKKYVGSDHTIVKTGTRFFQDGKEVIEGTWDNGVDSGPFRIERPAGGIGQTGPWTGWFEQGGQRHSIIGASLDHTGSSLSGSGTDDFGAFTWEGENLDDGQVVLRKKYVGSDATSVYTGTRFFQDGKEVIEGTWDLSNGADSGPFHISTPAKPLVGVTVSIRSTVNTNAYLRIGGDGVGDVNLQVGRSSDERFELVPLEVVGGEQVYAIKSALLKLYLHLDPTLSPEQAPTPGTTFHPNGVGFTVPVKEVDAQSKFTVVVNNVDGVTSFSFKLLNPGTAFKEVFLRLDTNKLATENSGSGGGEVNGQTYIGPLERLLIEPFP